MHSNVLNKTEILDALRRSGQELRRLGVRRLGLFGSFARGEQTHSSDIDLLVEFETGEKTFDRFMRLAFFLEDLLGRRVDLVTSDGLCAHLRGEILDEVEYASIAA